MYWHARCTGRSFHKGLLQPPRPAHLKDTVCDAAVDEWYPDSQAIQFALELREDEGNGCGTASTGGGKVHQT